MVGRRPMLLLRWASALALAALLLAAQQVALLHPLSHLGTAPQAHAHADIEAQASADAELGCNLCLACAAATPLAATARGTAAALHGDTPDAVDAALPRLTARAPTTAHNRGPPGRA